MKKKFKTIAVLGGLCALCIGLGACGRNKTMLEKYEAKGYVISVEYNANGGRYQDRNGITIVDMFNPSDYEADENDQVHIKLTEPTDSSRPSGSSDKIILTKQNSFFAGWYQTREVKKNETGEIVDTKGKKLEYDEKTKKYYYEEKNEKGELVEGEPAYEYSDYWDFENDTLDYELDSGKYKIKLYAGWVEYFEFEYYRQVNGKWQSYATTSFDYKTTNAENSKTSDKDTIFLPDWKDGAMNYETKYQDKSPYVFPKVEKMTFSAAYTDEACTQEISDSFEHQGVLHASVGENKKLVLENTVQKIYVKFDEGDWYKISTAEQLIKNVNLSGYYEILNDLDFVTVKEGKTEQLDWPVGFSSGEFSGKMYSTEGNMFTIKNASAKFYDTNSINGGLFGSIGDGAVVKNLTFENVTTDIQAVGRSAEHFGLFAGYISDKATVTGITAGGWLKLSGQITFLSTTTVSVNLLANGATSGVTKSAIGLQVYGQETIIEGKYSYNFAPTTENVAVSADGTITIKEFVYDSENANEFVNIIDIGN